MNKLGYTYNFGDVKINEGMLQRDREIEALKETIKNTDTFLIALFGSNELGFIRRQLGELQEIKRK